MTQRLTRQEAKAVGAARCFGAPCRKHPELDGERYVSGACVACSRETVKESRRKNPERLKEHTKKRWQRIKQDPVAAARKKQQNAAYVKKNMSKLVADTNKRRALAPELFRAYVKKCKQRNPAAVRANTAKRRAARMLRTPAWLTVDDHWLMQEAYALAELRTKTFGFVWHVDHIIPLQGELVSGLHTPENLQVIPWYANIRKANKHDPTTFVQATFQDTYRTPQTRVPVN